MKKLFMVSILLFTFPVMSNLLAEVKMELIKYTISSGGSIVKLNNTLVHGFTIGQVFANRIEKSPITFSSGFWNDSTKITDVEESSIKYGSQNSLTLFPNPSSGFMNISFQTNNNDNINYEIYSLESQLLVQGNILKSYQEQSSSKIDISSLNNGFYILKLHNSEETISKSFIIIH
jgi:hypothetical protein